MIRPSLVVLSIFSFALILTVVPAQLGEVAGQPHFNVSLGGTNTIYVTMINQAPYPLPIRVILPQLISKDVNAITPTLKAYPMVANIPPNSELNINLTVYMPEGTNKAGYTWSGILQVVTEPNTTANSGATGATIIEGVAKIVSITATAHVTTIYDYLAPAAIVIAVVAIAAGILVARRKGMFAKKAPKAIATKGVAKKGKGARRKRKARKGRKEPARARRGRTGTRRARRRRRR
ncbi:MAG: hypothetical protein KGH94_00015 [Candidatus Micrarchaeota archaeon]|nr:hypothetical protein [Candidatus Micrarchaeota archaeon]